MAQQHAADRPHRAATSASESRSSDGGPGRSVAPAGGLQGFIARRVADATENALSGPDERLMAVQEPVWKFLADRYFRVEVDGWDLLPDEPTLLVGVHSGGSLTMDAWTFVHAWWRRFGRERILHGTAHDVLMAAPGLGDYFRLNAVLPASRRGVTAALGAGDDVIVWPGGEEDAMRSWRKRDTAVLAGRKGFVRQAIRSGVPIVPVATIGGHDTVFVLSEGRWLADGLDRLIGLKKRLRGATLPIALGVPFGIAPEILPTHIPLPAKIRTELLEPIRVDTDPARVDDRQYVDRIYREVETAIQAGMNRLAKRRRLPVFG
jgi:1-acyl-sn-glycerol-3-phosphate acyltransferase